MKKVLDLNNIQRPVLELTLPGPVGSRKVLTIFEPTEGMVEELSTLTPSLRKLQTGDLSAARVVYDLAARLISRNQEWEEVTAEDLRDKYKLDQRALMMFFSDYLDFVHAIQNIKN